MVEITLPEVFGVIGVVVVVFGGGYLLLYLGAWIMDLYIARKILRTRKMKDIDRILVGDHVLIAGMPFVVTKRLSRCLYPERKRNE